MEAPFSNPFAALQEKLQQNAKKQPAQVNSAKAKPAVAKAQENPKSKSAAQGKTVVSAKQQNINGSADTTQSFGADTEAFDDESALFLDAMQNSSTKAAHWKQVDISTQDARPCKKADMSAMLESFGTAGFDTSKNGGQHPSVLPQMSSPASQYTEQQTGKQVDNKQTENWQTDNKRHGTSQQHSKSTAPAPKAQAGSEQASSFSAMANPSSPTAPQETENDIFAKAMQGICPLSGKGRELPPPVAPKETPPAQDPDYLADFLRGNIEFKLEHTEEFFEGHVSGVDPLILSKLRAGNYSPESHVDLHGMTAEQAYDALIEFIRLAYTKGQRTLVVVTGRGKNSPGGISVLRQSMQDWLTKDPLKRVVLAFCTAQQRDGGAGALYVLLRKYKKKQGKIRWERTGA